MTSNEMHELCLHLYPYSDMSCERGGIKTNGTLSSTLNNILNVLNDTVNLFCDFIVDVNPSSFIAGEV